MSTKSTKTKNQSTESSKPTASTTETPVSSSGEGEIAYDPQVAEKAYQQILPIWQKLQLNQDTAPNVSIEYVSSRLVKIGVWANQSGTLARFQKLPEFDIQSVKDLLTSAWAIWYARVQLLTAQAQSTEAQIPQELYNRASQLRDKMWKTVDYNCANDTDPNDPVAKELASIREVNGSRYLDLANDLARLSTLYRTPELESKLRDDKRRYAAADAKTASALAAEVLRSLGKTTGSEATWANRILRGWQFIGTTYAEVRAGALYLERHNNPEERFPLLGAMRLVRDRGRNKNNPQDSDPAQRE